jgi:hypothetical protein
MYYYSELLEDEGQVEMATAMIEEGRDLARIAGDEREALRFDMSLAGVLIETGRYRCGAGPAARDGS